jgi:ribonuclease Y
MVLFAEFSWVNTLVTAGVAFAVALVVIRILDRLRRQDAQTEAERIVSRAEADAANRVKAAELEIKEQSIRFRAEADREMNAVRDSLRDQERELDRRQAALEQQAEDVRKQERIVEGTQRRLTERLEDTNRRNQELTKLLSLQRQTLHELSGLSAEEATARMLNLLETELQEETGAIILKHQKKMEESLQEQAREMLLVTLQRYAATHTAESTTSTVDIPNDEMKGRIIGREGRNIRAFEKETGVDVIIDDTPGVVIVSGFDPVRREIGRQALNKLIADGRIHPTRIEEVVAETRAEIEQYLDKQGEHAIHEVELRGVHPRIVHMLGRLHLRTSYSQNVLRHSVEVAYLTGMLAELVGLDAMLGRRCGLLHDIGKAADHDMEGGHPRIGAEILKRHGEGPEVVHAALGHHDEITTEHPYTVLVATADACSASRPGARRETLERYIKRMEELEEIATAFAGVDQAFAIQAGRELRVLVNAREVDDARAAKICRDVAKAFEERLTYPGEIKVTVVRESRFSETAR